MIPYTDETLISIINRRTSNNILEPLNNKHSWPHKTLLVQRSLVRLLRRWQRRRCKYFLLKRSTTLLFRARWSFHLLWRYDCCQFGVERLYDVGKQEKR